MERIAIKNSIDSLKSGNYSIASFDDITIKTEVNSTCDILLLDLAKDSTLSITISESSNVTLSVLAENDINQIYIEARVLKNGYLNINFADFSQNGSVIKSVVNLDEEGAKAYCKTASLSSKKDNKCIDINVNHNRAKTYGKVDNYGVCKDDGKLTFIGTSYILKGSIKSKTEQNAKIMVFDKACNAIAKPVLKIDENDIEASHAAAVGKINDEHLFYLTSRGIDEQTAKQLITYGYLKPILAGFKEENIKEHISSLIEGRM